MTCLMLIGICVLGCSYMAEMAEIDENYEYKTSEINELIIDCYDKSEFIF